MERHVTAVGILFICLSILGILIGGLAFVLLAWVGSMLHEEDASVILSTIGFIVWIFLFLISVPGIIGGIGLLNRKEWARILVLMVSAMYLIIFPIGTAVGAYSIWVLIQQETIRLFNPIVLDP